MYMRLLQWVLLIVVCCSCKNEFQKDNLAHAKNRAKIQRLDSLVQSLVANGHSAGVALGVQIGDEAPYMASYGLADVEEEVNVETNTIFGLASITKPFTAVAIAQLIEKGKFGWETPLTHFFPSFPEGDKVTIYQLLSHTSGINEWWIGGLPEGVPEDWITGSNPHQYLQQMRSIYLFEPGGRYSYSNMGYLLLGEIIEKVSGKPYQVYLREHIFDPLEMNRTSLVPYEETFVNMAKGHRVSQENDSIKAGFVTSLFIASSLKSFGGLKSTVGDMLKWSKALFDENLVNKEGLERMVEYAKVTDGKLSYEARYVDPKFTPPSPLDFMKKDGYGLGFSLTEIFGKKAIWHSGGMPGYNALWFYFPESETSLVILSNTDNGIMPAFEEIMKVVTQS